ncbi:MAG: DUF2934 domain-containing protein [Acetobacteraceae bacterium]|nr:DUF2934 domain-containing protein [Acetobacteraceae bacterium]
MDHASEQEIRERAYALWEKEGSPEGRDTEFWERARLIVERGSIPARDESPRSEADREVDVAMKDTFPASDPPAFTADRGAVKN